MHLFWLSNLVIINRSIMYNACKKLVNINPILMQKDNLFIVVKYISSSNNIISIL